LRRFSLALAGLCACVLFAGASNGTAKTDAQSAALTWLGSQIHGYQVATWHWQHVMGVATTRSSGVALSAIGIKGAKDALARWQRRAKSIHRLAEHPPHYAAFMCIHHYEGSWSDSGAPFWGGLQMNYGFQATYGSWLLRTKGTADHWTPLEQIWVAERAARSRGFYPWPNTARSCGLI
jgi:hypothetical protein